MRFDDENSHEQYCHHFSMNRYSRHTTASFLVYLLNIAHGYRFHVSHFYCYAPAVFQSKRC
ncbi:hypothetical protein PROSTU_04009 [Providencia stuartii ATCC 25827]|uniref:Uncharacterized protein n=1 Tax=Providencia stuartii ATCC 25827 TaxID=471874 RepID=A0AA86YGG4_PROST|nr:hypothetical protein PROSTU_04009 [Providencia stuartii ATCC 25827]